MLRFLYNYLRLLKINISPSSDIKFLKQLYKKTITDKLIMYERIKDLEHKNKLLNKSLVSLSCLDLSKINNLNKKSDNELAVAALMNIILDFTTTGDSSKLIGNWNINKNCDLVNCSYKIDEFNKITIVSSASENKRINGVKFIIEKNKCKREIIIFSYEFKIDTFQILKMIYDKTLIKNTTLTNLDLNRIDKAIDEKNMDEIKNITNIQNLKNKNEKQSNQN
jgi:hypothetical protein